MAGRAPTRQLEKELWAAGHDVIVGIDEVGRGAWAGPLMVGAAILPREKRVNGVRDSKLLTERNRELLFDRVAGWCEAWAVGGASQEECDELGMAAAQKLATQRAIAALGVVPDAAVVDGKWNFVSPCVPHVEGYGPSAIHRRTWVFMDHYVPWPGVPRVVKPEQPTLF